MAKALSVFYFGGVCNESKFEETISRSKVKPSNSSEIFELNVLRGLQATKEVDFRIVSTEIIATYPNGYKLFLKKRIDCLFEDTKTLILPSINLPLLKPWIYSKKLKREFKKWIKDTQNTDRCVLTYGLYSYATKQLLKLCKKHNIKSVLIMTDSPSFSLRNYDEFSSFARYAKQKVKRINLYNEQRFDGYVFLTDYFSELVPNKPYIIVEAISSQDFISKAIAFLDDKFIVMYAGTLYKTYGIDVLIEAFKTVPDNCELWIFGSGEYTDAVKKAAIVNDKIKFYGRVSRQTILDYEKKASLLVLTRLPNDEYTKYSFPSKIVEYMLSGTPVLTTKLLGIPNEYFDYVFTIDECSAFELSSKITSLSLTDKKTMCEFGDRAARFVSNNKNYIVQGNKILKFLKTLVLNDENHTN